MKSVDSTYIIWRPFYCICGLSLLCLHLNLSYLLLPAGDLFTEAAEAAMAAMKGRLANLYYMKAEEAWAMMEE